MKKKRKSRNASLRSEPYRVRFFQTIKYSSVIILILVMLASVVWGIMALRSPHTFPFRHIKIKASANHIDATQLKQTVASHLNGGFFSLQSFQLRQALLALPWVKDVSLRRVWPNQLEVNIEERQPLARWGKIQLMDASGALFQPMVTSIPQNLPELDGPDGSASELIARYQYFSKLLSPIGVTISEMRLSDRGAWLMVLNNHIEVMMGRKDIDQRFARFVALYMRVIGKNENNVESIDLRYPNGIAIQWKKTHNNSATTK